MKQKPEPIVIKAKTISLISKLASNKGINIPSQIIKSLAIAPNKKRVFTEDEWNYLQTLSNIELMRRIETGNIIIRLLGSPQTVNTRPSQASQIASNLKFQQDAIRDILTYREKVKQSNNKVKGAT